MKKIFFIAVLLIGFSQDSTAQTFEYQTVTVI